MNTLFSRVLITTLALTLSAQAFAALKIIPKRVVLDKERSAELTLINDSDQTKTYRLYFKNLKVYADGGNTRIEEPEDGQLFADKFIRYSPRQITIEPNAYQRIRVMARKPKNMAEGEYRSHLVFKTLPPKSDNTLNTHEDPTTMGVKIQPSLELSIPVILRNGSLNATAKIDNIAFEPETRRLDIEMSRAGTRSLYGSAKVLLNGEQQVGFVKGIAVYTPNTKRTFSLALELPETFDAKSDKLEFIFTEDPKFGGNATANFDIDLSNIVKDE